MSLDIRCEFNTLDECGFDETPLEYENDRPLDDCLWQELCEIGHAALPENMHYWFSPEMPTFIQQS